MGAEIRSALVRLLDAMIDRRVVRVTTATRKFSGYVNEIGKSPYEEAHTCRVVDREGRVHYFRPERAVVEFP